MASRRSPRHYRKTAAETPPSSSPTRSTTTTLDDRPQAKIGNNTVIDIDDVVRTSSSSDDDASKTSALISGTTREDDKPQDKKVSRKSVPCADGSLLSPAGHFQHAAEVADSGSQTAVDALGFYRALRSALPTSYARRFYRILLTYTTTNCFPG